VIRNIRSLLIRNELNREDDYAESATDEKSLEEQLRLFNGCWASIRRNVPYYCDLARANRLPVEFGSWNDVVEAFPVIKKDTFQKCGGSLSDTTHPPDWYRMTGGSTAQPVQIPAWNSENGYTAANAWRGRSWYGINPHDRLFMLWGHSHLFGTGWHGMFQRRLREAKDKLLGYYRYSAYNLDEKAMRQAARAILRFHPDYMIGYSVALDAFARWNEDKSVQLNGLRLKAVIGAAEGFPADDSVEIIKRVTGAPVAMEYGSVETNLIAHTHPAGGYRVPWRTYFIEASEVGPSGGNVVRITSLYPRCSPLIRYEIGDEINLYPDQPQIGVKRFARVTGRCNDYLLLADGSRIHAEVITHAVRSYHEIRGYQAVQDDSGTKLKLLLSSSLSPDISQSIRYRLGLIHKELADIAIEPSSRLYQTIAGKTPIVVRKESNK
jgi:phenylacetate-coenzyme A ligase PaaK-like adenylate-forming protein